MTTQLQHRTQGFEQEAVHCSAEALSEVPFLRLPFDKFSIKVIPRPTSRVMLSVDEISTQGIGDCHIQAGQHGCVLANRDMHVTALLHSSSFLAHRQILSESKLYFPVRVSLSLINTVVLQNDSLPTVCNA